MKANIETSSCTFVPLKSLKPGAFFRLSSSGKVYIKGPYDRQLKKYECQHADDMNSWTYFKTTKPVTTDFIY